jgi:peptide/nickel transport system substrate-binding protein
MKPPAAALAVLAAAALAACGDPPPVASGSTALAPEDAAPAAGGGKLVAGVGYDPRIDPLVNPPTLLQAYDPGLATEDDWLVTTLDGNPNNLNAIMASSNDEFIINAFLYESPFTFNGKLEWIQLPHMVESLEDSPDRKVTTLKLKPGLQWHDGTPFTARDIEFSYHQIMDPVVVTPQKQGTDQLETVRALDDRTVQFVHREPQPVSRWNMNFSILPKHLYEKGKAEDPTLQKSPYYAELNRKGVGNGPYRLIEWKEGDKLVFERWDGYRGPRVHFKRVICRIIPDQNIQLLTFEGGQTDEMELIAKHFADATVRSEKFRQVGYKARGEQWLYSYIAWNQDGSNPFFVDRRVRHAMTHATNIKLMIEKLCYNLNPQCYGIWHPSAPMFSKDVQLLPFDPARAATLLDEAGWKVSDEDGWRYKDGNKFSFTLLMPQGATVSVEVAAILQQDLKSLGVEMKTQVMEWATYQERTRKHEFQASIAAWGTGSYPDTAENIWHSKNYDQEGGRNYVGFRNARVDELFELAKREFDEAKRMAYFGEIQKIIYDEQPYTFLWNRPILWAFNRRIRGVQFSPRGVWNFDPSHMAWWVARGEQAYGAK